LTVVTHQSLRFPSRARQTLHGYRDAAGEPDGHNQSSDRYGFGVGSGHDLDHLKAPKFQARPQVAGWDIIFSPVGAEERKRSSGEA
jgi:hypothetical protein